MEGYQETEIDPGRRAQDARPIPPDCWPDGRPRHLELVVSTVPLTTNSSWPYPGLQYAREMIGFTQLNVTPGPVPWVFPIDVEETESVHDAYLRGVRELWMQLYLAQFEARRRARTWVNNQLASENNAGRTTAPVTPDGDTGVL